MINRCFAAAALVLAASCATPIMTEEECLAGNWESAGFGDGRNGLLFEAINERAAACAEVGVVPDEAAYAAGREQGLAGLCTESSGFAFGREGSAYWGVCTASSESAFLSGYLPGRRLGAAERYYAAAQSEYDNAINNLESVRWGIRDARRTLADPEAKEKAKRYARNVLDRADRNIQYANDRIDKAIYELGRAEADLENTESSLPSWRKSPDYFAQFDVVSEVGAFARSADAISHCTDEKEWGAPICYLRGGGILTSTDGILCAAGPGEARLGARARRYDGEAEIGARHGYDYFPYDERGRPLRRPAGFFETLFNQDRQLEGVLCAVAEPVE